MRIDRSQFDEDSLDLVYLLHEENEKYLTHANYIFLSRGTRKDIFGWFSIVQILLGMFALILLFGYLLYKEWNQYHLLATEGKTVLAILVDKQATPTRNNNYSYHLHYLYEIDNQVYPIELNVSLDEYEAAEANKTILYAASNPALATVDLNRELGQVATLRNFIILIIVCYLIFLPYRFFRKVRLIPASITRIEAIEQSVLAWDMHLLELSYEFISPKNQRLISTKYRIPASNPRPMLGQTLAVIYDGDRKYFIL